MPEPSVVEPCPFCGGTKIEEGYGTKEIGFMVCMTCGAEGPVVVGTQQAAAAEWNRRAGERTEPKLKDENAGNGVLHSASGEEYE